MTTIGDPFGGWLGFGSSGVEGERRSKTLYAEFPQVA